MPTCLIAGSRNIGGNDVATASFAPLAFNDCQVFTRVRLGFYHRGVHDTCHMVPLLHQRFGSVRQVEACDRVFGDLPELHGGDLLHVVVRHFECHAWLENRHPPGPTRPWSRVTCRQDRKWHLYLGSLTFSCVMSAPLMGCVFRFSVLRLILRLACDCRSRVSQARTI